MTFSVVDPFFQNEKTPHFSQAKAMLVGPGLALRLGLREFSLLCFFRNPFGPVQTTQILSEMLAENREEPLGFLIKMQCGYRRHENDLILKQKKAKGPL